ncbi:hypothetical protein C8Q75DRAFT_863742 [Abortiporus biennis]|nr:hypothetical protein C8Q75DRAFT_863742 [Abortiporus biennis]
MSSQPRKPGRGYIPISTQYNEESSSESPLSANTPLRADTYHVTPHDGTLIIHKDGHSYTYSYGPKGIPGLFHNSFALACAVFASLGGLTFGYDQGVVANVLVMPDFLQRWPITPLQKGLMTAMLELGALLGALTAGTFADRISRRQSIIIACFVFCLGSSMQFGAQKLWHLILGRAVGGLGVGALSMLSPLYMAEISPPEVRGSLMALEQFAIVLGAVLGFWTGFFTRSLHGSASWRTPLGIQIIPGIFLAFGSIFLPPSPRLLVAQGRYDEARNSLARLRRRNPSEAESDPLVQIELLEMRSEVLLMERAFGTTVKESGIRAEIRTWGRLFSKKYRDRTFIGVLMMFFQQWSGINALLYYGPTLVQSIGLQGDKVTLMVSGGIGIVQFFAVLPAILYIDRLGRKPLLRWGSAVMCFAHLAIAVLVRLYEDDWSAHVGAAWSAVGCVYLFTAAYGTSYGPIGWILPSEVFPISVRSKGVSLSTASNWFNNFLIGLVTPLMMEQSASVTFITFSTACFLGYFWSTYRVPETGNVPLEEIDAVFSSSVGAEDSELKDQIEREIGLHDLIADIGAESSLDEHE